MIRENVNQTPCTLGIVVYVPEPECEMMKTGGDQRRENAMFLQASTQSRKCNDATSVRLKQGGFYGGRCGHHAQSG